MKMEIEIDLEDILYARCVEARDLSPFIKHLKDEESYQYCGASVIHFEISNALMALNDRFEANGWPRPCYDDSYEYYHGIFREHSYICDGKVFTHVRFVPDFPEMLGNFYNQVYKSYVMHLENLLYPDGELRTINDSGILRRGAYWATTECNGRIIAISRFEYIWEKLQEDMQDPEKYAEFYKKYIFEKNLLSP